ncbi:LPD29 domain-containing protein [Methylobacterium sp. E-045]|uniref:LPD29 domain-containing protein n=1 Tax=Methylobacterium sp. E-045 TaxID=2836575 RepID=UPI001FBB0C96|nr:LPD29 domain-containing protein [Methylobacterium sp. E-045]MCJ2129240.1 hypothetical protein [Methylobacterium sp. E-045]
MTATALPASIANLTQTRRYLSCAETAKMIRTALKQAFPEIKFSVRSSNYAGGASIRVGWVDGPRTAQVEAIAKTFSGASFDGMQDLKSSNTHTVDGQPVRFGSDYVFCNRECSDAARANLIQVLEKLTVDERDSLVCSLRLQVYDRGSDDVRSLARSIFHALPRPEFDGRRSALVDSINNITAD